MREDILLVEDFLTVEEVHVLGTLEFTPYPLRADARLRDVVAGEPEALRIASEVRSRSIFAVSKFYDVGPMYCDYVSIHAIGPDNEIAEHPLHADAENLDGTPNHTAWRELSALIYLSTQGTDFDGGSIVFPYIHETITPRAGMFVGFTAARIHAHAVAPVTRGVRKALAMWFTSQPERDEYGWS